MDTTTLHLLQEEIERLRIENDALKRAAEAMAHPVQSTPRNAEVEAVPLDNAVLRLDNAEPPSVGFDFKTLGEMLPKYHEDSPFVRKDLKDHQLRVEHLGDRLKAISSKATEFVKAASHFAEIAAQLGAEMSAEWSALELDVQRYKEAKRLEERERARQEGRPLPTQPTLQDSSEVQFSLGSSMGSAGVMLASLGEVSRNLALSLDTVLVKSVNEFRNKHIRQARESYRTLEKLADDFENAMNKMLNRKISEGAEPTPANIMLGSVLTKAQGTQPAREPKEVKDKPTSGGFSIRNFVHKHSNRSESILLQDDIANEKENVCTLRRAFELHRFDHTALLTDIETLRVADLVQMACASFYSVFSFFHEGHHTGDITQPTVDSLNLRVQHVKHSFIRQKEENTDKRTILEAALVGQQRLNFRVTDAFPRPFRPESFTMRRGEVVLIEKEGYLRKQSSNLQKSWLRRWFVLQNGQLFYFRSPQDLQPQHVVNVLICTVRWQGIKSELPFTFELISPNKRVYSLQAENEREFREWIEVFQNSIESMLNKSDTSQSVLSPSHAHDVASASLRS